MKIGEVIGIFVAVGLFIIAIITFASEIGLEYGYVNIMNDTRFMDIAEVKGNMSSSYVDINSSEDAFRADAGSITDDGDIASLSVWGGIKSMAKIPFNVLNIVLQGTRNVLGIDPFITGSIVALLSMVLIISIWRFVKTGDG